MKLNIIKGIFALTLLASVIPSCKKINPVEGVEQIFDATISEATVSFQFIDAKTGYQMDVDDADNIQIDIVGKNAADIVDNLNNNDVGAFKGLMACGLKMGITPSSTNPIEFIVHATATGYLPVNKAVLILQEGHQHFVVKMIKVSDTPAGVSATQGSISAVPASGVTTADFTLSPTAVTATGTTASVTIPAGTKLMDQSSVAISGSVTTTLAYFNPKDAEFGSSAPGDLMRAKLSDGTFASFNSFGMVAMQMTSSNGKEIKKFGSPITMTMSIPDGATNFDGTPVAAGASYGVYSYDDVTAEWKHESDAVVQLNTGTGKLEVTFEMTHLSYWQVTDVINFTSGIHYNRITFSASCQEYFQNTSDIEYSKHCVTLPSIDYISTEIAQIIFGKEMYFVSTHPSSMSNYAGIFTHRWYRKSNPNDYLEVSADYNVNSTVTFPSSWCPVETANEFNIKCVVNCPDNPTKKIYPQCALFAVEGDNAFANVFSALFHQNLIPLGGMKNGELKTSTATLKKGKKYSILAMYGQDVAIINQGLVPVSIDGNDIDFSQSLSDFQCTYMRKIIGK